MPIAERMNIVPRLREASTVVSGWTLLDERGRRSAHVDLGTLWRLRNDVELPRGDLSTILYDASRDHAEFLFGDSITSLTQDGGGVDVAFERSRPRRFDHVIGTDGLHSRVRRLAFGPETEFVRHAGLYVASLPLPQSIDPGRDIIMLNAPGKTVGLHPSRDRPLVLLIFWHPEIPDFNDWETEQHKRILETMFGDVGWRVPEILAAAHASRELWFDAVSVVKLANWARGRVAVLGDASSCASLFGDGSSLAIAGAYTLAAALADHPTDYEAACQYQSVHNKLVAPRLKALRLWPPFSCRRPGSAFLSVTASWLSRDLPTQPRCVSAKDWDAQADVVAERGIEDFSLIRKRWGLPPAFLKWSPPRAPRFRVLIGGKDG